MKSIAEELQRINDGMIDNSIPTIEYLGSVKQLIDGLEGSAIASIDGELKNTLERMRASRDGFSRWGDHYQQLVKIIPEVVLVLRAQEIALKKAGISL